MMEALAGITGILFFGFCAVVGLLMFFSPIIIMVQISALNTKTDQTNSYLKALVERQTARKAQPAKRAKVKDLSKVSASRLSDEQVNQWLSN